MCSKKLGYFLSYWSSVLIQKDIKWDRMYERQMLDKQVLIETERQRDKIYAQASARQSYACTVPELVINKCYDDKPCEDEGVSGDHQLTFSSCRASRVNHRATAHLWPFVTALTPWGFSLPALNATMRPHWGFTTACREERKTSWFTLCSQLILNDN